MGRVRKNKQSAHNGEKVTAHNVCLDGMEIRWKNSKISLLSGKYVFKDIASFQHAQLNYWICIPEYIDYCDMFENHIQKVSGRIYNAALHF